MSRGPYRRHSPQFELQLCHDIRAGTIGRKEAQRKYVLSANLVHLWLTQYDRGELDVEEVEATVLESDLLQWPATSRAWTSPGRWCNLTSGFTK